MHRSFIALWFYVLLRLWASTGEAIACMPWGYWNVGVLPALPYFQQAVKHCKVCCKALQALLLQPITWRRGSLLLNI